MRKSALRTLMVMLLALSGLMTFGGFAAADVLDLYASAGAACGDYLPPGRDATVQTVLRGDRSLERTVVDSATGSAAVSDCAGNPANIAHVGVREEVFARGTELAFSIPPVQQGDLQVVGADGPAHPQNSNAVLSLQIDGPVTYVGTRATGTFIDGTYNRTVIAVDDIGF